MSPGVLGFLIVVALGVATWLLIRSMGRQIRRIDFDEDSVERERRTAVQEPGATRDSERGQAGADSPDT